MFSNFMFFKIESFKYFQKYPDMIPIKVSNHTSYQLLVFLNQEHSL